MTNFDGIKPEGIFLLSQNRFENSKEFYDANKKEIVKLVVNPMKQLASIIGEDMFKVDEKMELNPSKMISRIRRDTRYSKDKSLYRENMWIMFMRNKHIDTFVPCFWFEVFPDRYTCGVAPFDSNARIWELFRQKMIDEPKAFEKAVNSCLKAGFDLSGKPYKKEKEGTDAVPKKLRSYYNMRNISFMRVFPDVLKLQDEECIDELRSAYKALTPYYKFLLEIYEQYNLERSEYSYEQRGDKK